MTLHILNDAGEFVESPYDVELMSFEFEGTCITNPYRSECGRFAADPKQYGFIESDTGSVCTSLILMLPNGDSLCLTDESGCHIPDLNDLDDVMYGRFNANNEQVAWMMLSDLPVEFQ